MTLEEVIKKYENIAEAEERSAKLHQSYLEVRKMTNKEQTIANLKKLKSVHNGSYGADIDRAIKALERASWIPVSEPPKKNGEYIVTLVDEDSNGDNILMVDKAYWTGMNWTYKFDFALFDGGEWYIKPIAYMPLPEPYKVESEDEE